MADPISIATGAVRVISTTIPVVESIVTTINRIMDAPNEVRDLGLQVQGLATVLSQLRDKAPAMMLSEQLVLTLDTCLAGCTKMEAGVAKWANKSAFTLAVLKAGQVKSYKAQILDYQQAVEFSMQASHV